MPVVVLKSKTFSCTLQEQVPTAKDVWQEILALDNSISIQTGVFWKHNKSLFPWIFSCFAISLAIIVS